VRQARCTVREIMGATVDIFGRHDGAGKWQVVFYVA
jgi:hypothetical protein